MKSLKIINKFVIDLLYKNYLFYLEVGGEPIKFKEWLELYNEFLKNENFEKIYNNHLHELEEESGTKQKLKKGRQK